MKIFKLTENDLLGIKKLDKFDNIARDIVDHTLVLKNELINYIEKTSLHDFMIRKLFIKRIVDVFERFWNCLFILIDYVKDNSLVINLKEINGHIEYIICFKQLLNWYQPFESSVYINFKNALNESAELSNIRGLTWLIKREFNKPILECNKSLYKLINKLIKRKLSESFLITFALPIEWLILLWSFNNVIPKEQFLFYSKSKFNLTDNILLKTQSNKYAIELSEKFIKMLENFTNNLRVENNLVHLLIEKN